MRRSILTLREKESLSEDDKFLYDPYRNLVSKFYELATDANCKKFDIVSREFNGMNNAEENVRPYYEALLGVSSYFQSSKGGRGKYLEKKLASVSEMCSLENRVSELPLLLLHTDPMRKKKLHGKESLNSKEKEVLRLCEWDFVGERHDDQTTDLVSLFKDEGTIAFLELKNRVDSGGTASRREVFDTKFRRLLGLFTEPKPLFKFEGKTYDMASFLEQFGIRKVTLNLGILFGLDGKPATMEGDHLGFYSSSLDNLRKLCEGLEKANVGFEFDERKLLLKLSPKDGFSVEVGNLYGNDIPQYLFHKRIGLDSLIRNKYDDIWLFQLLAIDERHHLLRAKENTLLNLKAQLKADHNLRVILNDFIKSRGENPEDLKPLIAKLKVNPELIPKERNAQEYLIDVLYFISANEI